MDTLETVLWVLASIAAFAAFIVFVPTLFNIPAGGTPTAVARPTNRPTLTRIPTPTVLKPSSPQRNTPIPLPNPGPGAQVFVFPSEQRRSGWFVTGEQEPHWGDRNLHAGKYKGQVYQSLILFDLAALAPGSKILFAEVEVGGLSQSNLGPSGSWTLGLVPFDFSSTWVGRTNEEFRNVAIDPVGAPHAPQDLAEAQINQFVFTAGQVARLENALQRTGRVGFRLDGPSVEEGLFTWDGGDRDPAVGIRPTLRVVAVPEEFVLVTLTPTPQNVITAAAALAKATEDAARFGTPTPLQRKYATALPMIAVTPEPTAANMATATARAAYATAVAQTTGTFTPTPLNIATVTPTSTPTPTPPFVGLGQFTPMPSPTPRATEVALPEYRKTPIPKESGLIGRVAFHTNREGGGTPVWVMESNGTVVGKLLGTEYHQIAAAHDLFSPDYTRHLDVGRDSSGKWQIVVYDIAGAMFSPLIRENQGQKGIGAYHGAWSPDGGRVAFVSERTGYSEIYVLDLATNQTTQLTNTAPDPRRGYPPYNKHPSWSPDGSQIVFFSDRDTFPPRNQIWIMDANGGGLRNLSPSPYDDFDPVWIKR